ncbi:hypothetical protein B0H13DRAFT_1878009 [Mycena leptocephala]|nr:hypothetical protein B0H13DRAFT_1878009 [Mycena leptocephala]
MFLRVQHLPMRDINHGRNISTLIVCGINRYQSKARQPGANGQSNRAFLNRHGKRRPTQGRLTLRQQADLGIQMEKGVDTPGINQEEHKSTYLTELNMASENSKTRCMSACENHYSDWVDGVDVNAEMHVSGVNQIINIKSVYSQRGVYLTEEMEADEETSRPNTHAESPLEDDDDRFGTKLFLIPKIRSHDLDTLLKSQQ